VLDVVVIVPGNPASWLNRELSEFEFGAPSFLSMSHAICVLTALSTGRAATWPFVFTTMARETGTRHVIYLFPRDQVDEVLVW